ncbi:MAG: hypothetical protein PVSMB6_16710 [Steroidobacteraceae bacterium]
MAVDLEITAELPVLDPADDPAGLLEPAEPADAHHTETWIVPRPVYAAAADAGVDESRPRLESSLRKAYAQLLDTEERLAARDERVRQLEEALQEARAATAGQLGQLRAVHEEFAAATAQRRAELEADRQAASAAAEQRANQLSGELAQAHGILAAAAERIKELQLELETREAQGRVRDNAVLERGQALVASERAHASALRELNSERERNALCLESLHRAESRRQVTHSVIADLQRELDQQQVSLTRLGHELASRDARVHEQDAELARRAARIMRLEQQAGSSVAPAPPPAAPASAATAAAEPAPRAAALPDPAAALAITAVIAHAAEPDGERASQEHEEGASARTRELETDLRAAEDTINRLESQARDRGARLEELEKASQQWRLAADEARATSIATSAASTAAPEAPAAPEVHATQDAAAHDPLPAGATRLLICKEQGREVVHVLGRKTSIGRTPDNDLQIDAKFISRHHAVILSGPVHTVVEDLHSTNGVLVNGQRVTRQMLKDGDEVVIGRAHYRFAVRRQGDKR